LNMLGLPCYVERHGIGNATLNLLKRGYLRAHSNGGYVWVMTRRG